MVFYTIMVVDGQTIWDIATLYYGGVDGVFLLRADNPTIVPDLNVDLVAGQELRIRKSPEVERVDVMNFMRNISYD